MIISFGWTTPALLGCRVHYVPLVECGCNKATNAKGVTRRDWTYEHAMRVEKLRQEGREFDAWNTSPRNKKGNPHKIATIEIIEAIHLESPAAAPAQDWYEEGFEYLTRRGVLLHGLTPRQLWARWQQETEPLYVVRFQVVEFA